MAQSIEDNNDPLFTADFEQLDALLGVVPPRNISSSDSHASESNQFDLQKVGESKTNPFAPTLHPP
jgi:hypothetical protein